MCPTRVPLRAPAVHIRALRAERAGWITGVPLGRRAECAISRLRISFRPLAACRDPARRRTAVLAGRRSGQRSLRVDAVLVRAQRALAAIAQPH